MLVKTVISAGQSLDFSEQANFFRLLGATGPVSVDFFANNAKLVEAPEILSGYSEKFREGFDRIRVSSQTTQEIQFVLRLGNDVSYDGQVSVAAGSFAVSNMSGAFTSAATAVTSTSGILATANSARRFLAVQNLHATGNVYINLSGAAATVTNGLKIPPGGSLLLDAYVPSGAITAIGDVASNTAVLIVEGA